MSSEKNLYVCTKCMTWLSGKKEEAAAGCPQCGGDLQYVNVDYYEYSSWLPDQKAKFKQQFLRDLTNKNVQASYTVEEVEARSKGESASSGWITGLKIISLCSFIVFVLLGLALLGMIGINALGFVALSVCLVVGFLSVAMTMVFLGMAQDIRIIRSRMKK